MSNKMEKKFLHQDRDLQHSGQYSQDYPNL